MMINKERILVIALSIICAIGIICAQAWGASNFSGKILWQIYLFNLIVFPLGMSGYLAPGESATIMRLDPEYWLIGMVECLLLSLILYSYLLSKLFLKIYQPNQKNLTKPVTSRSKLIICGVCAIAFLIFTFSPWISRIFGPKHPYQIISDYGKITFISPNSMDPRDIAIIRLEFDMKATLTDYKKAIDDAAEKRGEHFKASHFMDARLSSSNFDIIAITSDFQDLSENKHLEWQWKIKPNTDGHHNLHLSLSSLGSEVAFPSRRIISIDQEVEVKMNWYERMLAVF